jgi:hypothetical protein
LSTGDRAIEFVDPGGDWETIPTTDESYGWNPFDHAYKTPEFLIRVLAKAVSRGGNMLLNVGPMPDGRIDPRDVAILEGIGRWMDVNEAAIRGCGRAGLPVQPWGVVTAKAQTLYLHVFDWPESSLIVGGLTSTPRKAWLLGDIKQTELAVKRLNEHDLAAQLPIHAPSAADSVVVLEFDEAPHGGGIRLLSTDVPVNRLLVFDAERHGEKHQVETAGDEAGFHYGDGKINRYYVTDWTTTNQWLSWEFRLNQPARFALAVNYGKGTGTGAYEVRCDDWKVGNPVSAKVGIDRSFEESLGEINLPAGVHHLELRAMRVRDGELFRPLALQFRPLSSAK